MQQKRYRNSVTLHFKENTLRQMLNMHHSTVIPLCINCLDLSLCVPQPVSMWETDRMITMNNVFLSGTHIRICTHLSPSNTCHPQGNGYKQAIWIFNWGQGVCTGRKEDTTTGTYSSGSQRLSSQGIKNASWHKIWRRATAHLHMFSAECRQSHELNLNSNE